MNDSAGIESRPSIYEFAGGAPAFHRLTQDFYEKVIVDPLLAPVFVDFTQQHIDHVAHWLGEVFGGPAVSDRLFDGHQGILSRHLNLAISEAQRARWAELMIATAREVLPADALLQRRFAEYIEWGTIIAKEVSQPCYELLDAGDVPWWGWED